MACSMEMLDFMESCYGQENKKTLYNPPVLCFDLFEEIGKQVEIKRRMVILEKHKENFSNTLEEINFLGRSYDGAPLVSDFEENERNEYNPGWVNALHDEDYGFIKEFRSQYYITDAVWESATVNTKIPYWESLGADYKKWFLHNLVHYDFCDSK